MKFFSYLLVMMMSFSLHCRAQEQTTSLFGASQKQPYHLSIGAVLFDQEGRVACHHFEEILGHRDIYILMRESMENDETPLMTLHRGLMEEFGATATPVAFLGSLSGYLPDPHFSFDKTTLYFACQLIRWSPEDRDAEDPESSSLIEWLEPQTLIALMEQQGIRFHHRADADESEMVRRALPYIQEALSKRNCPGAK